MWRCVSIGQLEIESLYYKRMYFREPKYIITDKVLMLSVHESTSQHVQHSVKLLLIIKKKGK